MNKSSIHIERLVLVLKQAGRFLHLLLRQFRRDHCHQATAALTYTSLLALVPLLAVGLVVFHKLPFFPAIQHEAQAFILQVFAPEIGPELVNTVVGFIEKAANLTGISGVILLITAMMTLNTIDLTLNHIWKVERGRRTAINLLVYFVVILIGPLLVGLSVVMTTYLVSLTFVTDVIENRWLVWVPWLATFLAFTAVYRWVPNTHVSWKYAVSGGLVAAVLFEIAKRSFALYISWFPTYETIYGAMAFVPLMLVWIYLSWLVILIGAETAHCLLLMQHPLGDPRAQRALLPPFRILGVIFLAGPTGCDLAHIARQEQLSTTRISAILTRLLAANLISRQENGMYLLSTQISELGLAEIFDLLQERLESVTV